MRRALVLAALFAAMLAATSPASAWDPDSDQEQFDGPDPDRAATPEPVVGRPEGLYLVSETYVDDVVLHNGPVTTYATETVHEITGSYARVLESVPTGTSSGYDGSAFNGRAALTDGRAVAGTYYENYVRTENGFVAVSIVFFQDDLETARASRATPPPSQGDPVPPAAGAPTMPAQPSPPVPAGRPLPPVTPVGSVDPRIDDGPLRRDPDPARRPDPGASPPLPAITLEVLRARRTEIAFAYPGAVGWRFISGEGVALGRSSGAPGDRFVARWDRLAPVGGAWLDRFQVDFADGTIRELVVRVAVRAPGLVE